MKGIIRQGDVLLVPVDENPPVGILPQHQVVLAEGELTGHAHRLTAAEVYDWHVGKQRYVRVGGNAPGSISHEDHDPIPAAVVEPNTTYRVIRQQQWNLLDQWQKVQD